MNIKTRIFIHCLHLAPTTSPPLYIYNTQQHQKSYNLTSSLHLLSSWSSVQQMGFQDVVGGRLGCHYEKLTKSNEKVGRPGRHWVKKMNGRLKGLRLSRSRKLTLKIFSAVVWPSRFARICSDIVNKMKADGAYPTIIFSTQWGLPVLSHSSVRGCSINCSPNIVPIRNCIK